MIAVSPSAKLTPLDEQTFGNMSQMIKASVPYMCPQAAGPMAMLARFLELQNTVRYFKNPGKIQACGIGSRRPSPEEMLCDLRKYCDGNEARIIDTLLNAMKLGKFYEKFKDMENNPDLSRLIRMINTYSNTSGETIEPSLAGKCQNTGFGGAPPAASAIHGGETMKSSFDPEQILKNINPELLKNFDMNKFNQLVQAVNSGNFPKTQGSTFQGNNGSSFENSHTAFEPPVSGFNEEQLKSLLTPEQLNLYESLKKSMT